MSKEEFDDLNPEMVAKAMELGVLGGAFKNAATVGVTAATELIDELVKDKCKEMPSGSSIAALHSVITAVAAYLMKTAPNIPMGEAVSSSAVHCAKSLVEQMQKEEGDGKGDDKKSNNPFAW